MGLERFANADVTRLQALIVARLRAGATLGASNKEIRWEIAAEGTRGRWVQGAPAAAPTDGFVYEEYDQLVIGGEPVVRRVLATEAELIAWVRPEPDTPDAWAVLAGRLRPPTADEPAFAGERLEGRVVFGVAGEGPDACAWTAFAEGIEDRWRGGAMWPHARVCVEVAAAEGAADDGARRIGPFRWLLPVPPSRASRAGPDVDRWIDAEVSARLVDRLALVRLLDLTAPMPIDGGTWTARHADRYDTDGIGFDVTAELRDGRRVEVPVDLARPGTTDAARELPAARTRLRKALLRALRDPTAAPSR